MAYAHEDARGHCLASKRHFRLQPLGASLSREMRAIGHGAFRHGLGRL